MNRGAVNWTRSGKSIRKNKSALSSLLTAVTPTYCRRSAHADDHWCCRVGFRWVGCFAGLFNRTVALRDVGDGFPLLAPEIVQNLLMLFSLVLFGSINNQPERDYIVFPLHVLEFSRSAIRCQTAKPWR